MFARYICEAGLRLKVQHSSEQRCCILESFIIVDRTLDDVACGAIKIGGGGTSWDESGGCIGQESGLYCTANLLRGKG